MGEDGAQAGQLLMMCCCCVFGCFILVWHILGAVWVWGGDGSMCKENPVTVTQVCLGGCGWVGGGFSV